MPPRELTVTSGDVRLVVEDHGGDGTPLVLVHGSGANLRSWDLFIPHLGDRFRVVAYDLRSHGRTDASHDQSMAANVADIEAICAELGVEAPIVLGHSWGVPIALAYGAAHPECPGVIALDGITGPFGFGDASSWEELEESLKEDDFVMTPDELEGFLAQDQREAMKLSPVAPTWEEWVPTFRRIFRPGPDGRLVAYPTSDHMRDSCLIQMGGVDAYDLYERVAGAILVIVATGWDEQNGGSLGGTEGLAKRRHEIERLRKLRPDIQAAWLPCGHGVPLELPAELAQLTIDFADGVARSGG